MTKKQRANEIIERLAEEYPLADCTLDYDEAWKLLVSVRLAAQCTDARVNIVVKDLYEKFPDVNALAEADEEEIEEIVKELIDNVEVSVKKMQEVTGNVQKQQQCLDETREAFRYLNQEVKLVEEVTKEIGSQTEGLTTLKEIVTDSVNNLASVVEENAASTEETSASMTLLSQTISECNEDTQGLVELSHRQNAEAGKFQL